MQLPRVGMRMIKTAVAVFLCFVVTWLLSFVRVSENTAFFSAVVAILCIQTDVSNSLKTGLDRFIGTLIGAGCGLANLLLAQRLALPDNHPFLWYAFITVFTVLGIYLCLLVRRPGSSYISTVILLSIALVHGTGTDPFNLAWLRLTDTVIGIVVALVVNGFRWPHRKNRHILFLSAAEGVLFSDDGSMPTADAITLGQLLDEGMNLSLVTKHSPELLRPGLDSLPLRLPMIVLNGAALYDPVKREYHSYGMLDTKRTDAIREILTAEDALLFQYVMQHGQLHVFCTGTPTPQAQPFIGRLRDNPGNNLGYGILPGADGTLALYCTAATETAVHLYERLLPFEEPGQCRLVLQHNRAIEGYDEIFIYRDKYPIEESIRQMAEQQGCTKTIMVDFRTPAPFYPLATKSILVAKDPQAELDPAYTQTMEPEKAEKLLTRTFHGAHPL